MTTIDLETGYESLNILVSASFYIPFFKEVFEKKSEIERAFSMEEEDLEVRIFFHINGLLRRDIKFQEEEVGRLDDSGEGTLERPPPRRAQPVPPPRVDSYR